MDDKATMLKMTMVDGSEMEFSLTYKRLYRLRQTKPDVYEAYNRIAMDGMRDEFDFIYHLYVGYLCANIEELDHCLSYDEFLDILPPGHIEPIKVSTRLRTGDVEKKQDSGTHS